MQPMSALINLLTCIILCIFVGISKTYPVMIMFIAYLLFELWHTASHIQHIPGHLQTNVVHILGYLLSFTTLISILYLSKKGLPIHIIALLIITIIVDVYIWRFIGGIWTVVFGLLILSIIVIGSYQILPAYFKKNLIWLAFGLVILLSLIYNESVNCHKMMQIYEFPYHMFVELIGLMLFASLSYNFYVWEAKIHT